MRFPRRFPTVACSSRRPSTCSRRSRRIDSRRVASPRGSRRPLCRGLRRIILCPDGKNMVIIIIVINVIAGKQNVLFEICGFIG